MRLPPAKPATPTRRELRQFGSVLALLSGLYGVFLLTLGKNSGVLYLGLAGLIWAAFWEGWPATRAFYSLWMRVAAVLGQAMTCLLLTGLYFLVLTPLAFFARCCGERFIDKRFEKTPKSYWRVYQGGADHRDCEKQY